MYPLPANVYSDFDQIEVFVQNYERKCTFNDVFSLFEDDQMNDSHVTKMAVLCFCFAEREK